VDDPKKRVAISLVLQELEAMLDSVAEYDHVHAEPQFQYLRTCKDEQSVVQVSFCFTICIFIDSLWIFRIFNYLILI
jgi:hypothetical protein